MRFPWSRFGIFSMLGVSAIAGCADDDASQASAGSGGAGGPPTNGALIAFESGKTLNLAPHEARAVTAVTKPPENYAVSFTLVGDAGDASLDETLVYAGDDGTARNVLRAPNDPTTFRLRASIIEDDGAAEASAEIGVSVSAEGFGDINIVPVYAGTRDVTKWNAAVVAGTSCEALLRTFPEDPEGALIASAPEFAPLVIENAPVGPNLSVAVRSGHYIYGCADTADLEANGVLDVTVPVFDTPLDLTVRLTLEFDFEPDPEPFQKLVESTTGKVLDAVMGSKNDSKFLLDEMGALATPGSPSFAQQRANYGWDALVAEHLGALGVDFRELVTTWGASGIARQPRRLRAVVDSDRAGIAEFIVKRLGALPAVGAGFLEAEDFSWNSEGGDVLLLSGSLPWLSSQWFASSVMLEAKEEFPGASTVDEALAVAADCEGLGEVLGAFGDCDVDCVASLCVSALASAWADAPTASVAEPGKLVLNASGQALIDDLAVPIGLQGSWIGMVTDGTIEVTVQGAVHVVTLDPFSSPTGPTGPSL